jgi:RNA polymerase sigma-70 factor (ECF subfamily)
MSLCAALPLVYRRELEQRVADEGSSEAVLMARYCDGEAAAFQALYDALSPRLYGYLVGLIGERAAAEDLLQLTFLKLHEARASYVRGADPVPWIFTIAHRTFLDEIRKRRRARVQMTEGGQFVSEPRAEISGAPEGDEPPPSSISRVTLAALAQLPQDQREALMLTKVQGRTHAEAAAHRPRARPKSRRAAR